MTEESKRRRKTRIFFSLLILAMILIAFPFISVHYLNKGIEYRKGTIDELKELGRIPGFYAVNDVGHYLTDTTFRDFITVISHEAQACSDDKNETLKEYVEKFINQDAFRHVILTNDKCKGWPESYQADIDANSDLTAIFNELIVEFDRDDHILIVDQIGEIRLVYDLSEQVDVESLVTHTTLLLPPLKRR